MLENIIISALGGSLATATTIFIGLYPKIIRIESMLKVVVSRLDDGEEKFVNQENLDNRVQRHELECLNHKKR